MNLVPVKPMPSKPLNKMVPLLLASFDLKVQSSISTFSTLINSIALPPKLTLVEVALLPVKFDLFMLILLENELLIVE